MSATRQGRGNGRRGAICSWCVSSAIVFTLMAIVGTVRVLRVDAAEPVAVATG
jgi:uncharacterized membrane protein